MAQKFNKVITPCVIPKAKKASTVSRSTCARTINLFRDDERVMKAAVRETKPTMLITNTQLI